MAREIRRFGPFVIAFAVVFGIAALLLPPLRTVHATSYSTPHFGSTNPSPPCASCQEECYPKPAEYRWYDGDDWFDFGYSRRTGELKVHVAIHSEPGVASDLDVGICYSSYMSGGTQVGNGCVLSFEYTVEKEVLNPGDPDGSGGHAVYLRQPDGIIVTFDWDGTAYVATCCVTDTLTVNGSGSYELTSKHGDVMSFDANGMPSSYTDRNNNTLAFTYNSAYQITDMVGTRGGDWDFAHNTDGFLSEITNPGGSTWSLNYDTSGNLISVDTPATADQTSGVTIKLNRDASNRISSIEDAKGNQGYDFAFYSTTGQLTTATIDGEDISFSYASGRTDITDRLGNVNRYHYTNYNITQTDMWVGGVAKYATTYTYSGHLPVTIVYPRGNRVDMTWDGNDNLTERRHKTTNTASTSSSDIVHAWTYASNFVSTYTSPEGDVTTITRDSQGNPTTIAYADVSSPVAQSGVTKTIMYNGRGQVVQVTDEEGKVTRRHYHASGNGKYLLSKLEVDPTGLDLETTFSYDADGNVSSITDPEGHATTLSWDDARRLTLRTAPSPLSYETAYAYDANGNLVEVAKDNVDEDGDDYSNAVITTSFTYTATNRVETIVEEIDGSTTRTTTFAYDAAENRIRVTKPEGNKDKWEFDERGLVSKIIRGETATEAVELEFTYDVNGNLITEVDGRGNSTSHVYDLFDRRTKTTDPLGHYSEIAYNDDGRVTEIARKDSTGTTLQRRGYTYDERSRLWKVSDLRQAPGTSYSDAETQIERFKTGHVKTVTDARLKDTDHGYDNAWRRTSVTDAMGNERSWTLDKKGHPTAWSIEEVDGGSTVTHDYEATYDALGRRLTYVEIDRVTTSNKLTTTYGYDSRSNLVWLENAKGDPTRWTFDAAGRMTKKEVALATGATIEDFTSAIVREWGFDANDRLTSHKDDAGNTSTWAYDALGRVTELKYPDLKKITYVYDDNGNVTKTTDAAGNVIDDVYDANDRRTSRSVTLAAGFLGTTSETFTYDGLGRLETASDNDYKVEYEYSVIGLSSYVHHEKQSYVGGTAYDKFVKTTYDAVGNKTSEDYPGMLKVDYTYNDINRLDVVSAFTLPIADYDYVGGRVKGVTFGNGTTSTLTYTGFRSEVERIHHETSTPSTIVDLRYGYDANHDRTFERFGGVSASGDAFEYDKARRLTTAWMGSSDVTAPSSNTYTKKIEYVMDDDGNRSSVSVTPYGLSATTTSYTDNNLNQYTAVGGASRTHDGNGNLTSDGSLTYEYDYKNQIVRIKSGSNTVGEYKYDALGRRVEKDDGTDIERYIYSGDETISVYDGSDVWIRDFVFGQVIDEVLAMRQADVLDYDSDADTTESTMSFYHRNALGSVMAITDADEAEVVSYRYDPYGAVTITRNSTIQSSDPLGNPWMYTGRFTDEESGLYYYRARYYSPQTGRFLQRDPLGYAPGASLYQYASSSPPNRVDPMGLEDGPVGSPPAGSSDPRNAPKSAEEAKEQRVKADVAARVAQRYEDDIDRHLQDATNAAERGDKQARDAALAKARRARNSAHRYRLKAWRHSRRAWYVDPATVSHVAGDTAPFPEPPPHPSDAPPLPPVPPVNPDPDPDDNDDPFDDPTEGVGRWWPLLAGHHGFGGVVWWVWCGPRREGPRVRPEYFPSAKEAFDRQREGAGR